MRWLLIDKILECQPGVQAVGCKTFPRSDLIFMDHFPGFPIVPGVLQIEMIAQMGGKCVALQRQGVLPVLGSVKSAKFYQNIHPGDCCQIKVKVLKIAKSFALVEGEVEVDSVKMSAATILFGLLNRNKLSSNDFDAVSLDWLERQKAKVEAKSNSSEDSL